MMIRYAWTFLVASLFAINALAAEPHRLVSNTFVRFDLPSGRWQVSVEPPEAAIEAMYVDLAHGKTRKGESFDPAQLRAQGLAYLRTNNLFVFNEISEAHLMISISPFREGERPPSAKTVRRSAEWALREIEEHAEVEDLTPFSSRLEPIDIPGMKHAVRIEADYPLFGNPHHFLGIIGFAHPYWFFIYYNDKLKDERDLVEMRQILSSLNIERLK